MNSIFDIFKIGIGPSSSHTMGPMTVCSKIINRLERHDAVSNVKAVRIELFGSLAYTGKAHGTDKALIAGLSGFKPETVTPEEIKHLYENVIKNKTIMFSNLIPIPFDINNDIYYNTEDSPSYHSNALTVVVYTYNSKVLLEKTYYSIGGGAIVSENKIKSELKSHRFPYPYKSASDLLKICQDQKINIWELVLRNEKSIISESIIDARIERIWSVMNSSIEKGIATEGILDGGLKVERRAPSLFKQLKGDRSNDNLLELDYVNVYAIAVN